MTKKSEDERQTEILDAAVSYFAEKGYSAATTRDIAAAAGVAEGTIFRYFPTKKSMLHAITLRFLSVASDTVLASVENLLRESADRDLRSVLHDVLMDRMELAERLFPMARIVFTEMLYHEDIRMLMREKMLDRGMGMFQKFFATLEQRGMVRPGMDPEAVFRSMVANILVLVLQYKLFDNNGKSLEEAFDGMFDVACYGVILPGGEEKK